MKEIVYLSPSSYDEKNLVKKARQGQQPGRALPYLAALTPPYFKVRIVDEVFADVDFAVGDLIAMTSMIKQIPRAIDLSREFRKRGKKTIIGGVAAFALIDQLKGKFDAIVTGEVDRLWPDILADFENNRLKELYQIDEAPTLENLPFPRFDLIDKKNYVKTPIDREHPIIAIETSRGCPNGCSYCLVSQFFGKKMRYRPIADVTAEIKFQKSRLITFSDDNLLIHPERGRELMQAIKPLGIRWNGQFDASFVRHPDLMRLAKESGCFTGLVGVESLSLQNLQTIGKGKSVSRIPFEEIAAAFREHKIPLIASLMFGMEHDTEESIMYTIDQMIKHDVPFIYPWILTPIPRTETYETYRQQGRIVHHNFSLYDHWHTVIRPHNMSPEGLDRAFWRATRRFYSFKNSVRLLHSSPESKIHLSLMHLWYRNRVKRHLHPISY